LHCYSETSCRLPSEKRIPLVIVDQGGSILRELKKEAKYIVERSIETVQPESSVKNALEKLRLKGPSCDGQAW
jgi:hypothetical protein